MEVCMEDLDRGGCWRIRCVYASDNQKTCCFLLYGTMLRTNASSVISVQNQNPARLVVLASRADLLYRNLSHLSISGTPP